MKWNTMPRIIRNNAATIALGITLTTGLLALYSRLAVLETKVEGLQSGVALLIKMHLKGDK